MEFSALQGGGGEPVTETGDSVSPNPGSIVEAGAQREPVESDFRIRGKWLQFDCPHCVRPMRLLVDDAGGLVDCAHCGLELIAPEPEIGRGARLSRASEGRVGSIARYNLRDLRGDQLQKKKSSEDVEEFDDDEEGFDGFYDDEEFEELDPSHSLARAGEVGGESPFEAAPAGSRKRAVKALDSNKLGRSFQRKDETTRESAAKEDPGWEGGERPEFGESRQDKRGFWIAAAVAGLVMVSVIALIVKEAGKPGGSEGSGEVFDDKELKQIQAVQAAEMARYKGSFDAAKVALASQDWESLAAHVRNPDRVVPLMREFYSEREYVPVELTGYTSPSMKTVGDKSLNLLRVIFASGDSRQILMEGEKLDWEHHVEYPVHSWHQFLEARPAQPRQVGIGMIRSSLVDRYFVDAGLTREEGVGFKLWHTSADTYYAVLPKDSPVAKQLVELLPWSQGDELVIEASFDPDSELNDRVNIDRVVQSGWVFE